MTEPDWLECTDPFLMLEFLRGKASGRPFRLGIEEKAFDAWRKWLQCHSMSLGAQVAHEMIKRGEYEDVVSKWASESRRRWENSKFFKLWQKEQKAGRDPHKAFKERGWEP
jgi:hypothetical protein